MKSNLQLAAFSILILLTSICHAQAPDYNCDVDMSGSNGTSGTAKCKPDIPYDQTPEYKAEAARRAANDKQLTDAGAAFGNAIASILDKHATNKGIRKYCDQHPGDPAQWTENGKVVWRGTCPVTKAQIVAAVNAVPDKVGYAEAVGDKLILHNENASAMIFHERIANGTEFFPTLRTAGFKSIIYTNDTNQHYEFDLLHNREVTDTAKVAGTPTMATPAAPVARAATPCPAGTTLTTTSYGSACLAPTVAPTAPQK